MRLITRAFFFILFASNGTANAHTLVPVWPSLSEGVLHPLLGIDHCLALIGLGLWSQQFHLRFPARIFIPIMLMVMSVGRLLGHLAPQWPWVDHLIAASVFVIGALLTGLLPSHRLLVFRSMRISSLTWLRPRNGTTRVIQWAELWRWLFNDERCAHWNWPRPRPSYSKRKGHRGLDRHCPHECGMFLVNHPSLTDIPA